MKVGIIGGGVLGLCLAYYLSARGVGVTVLEANDRPGGLLDFFEVDGVAIGRYYHCILSGDTDLLALISELGLKDSLRFAETRQGFFTSGSIYPLAGAKDFLLFPPLSLLERFRLGVSILMAMRTRDWRSLDDTSVEAWLVGLGGRGVFEKLWKPLLRAKFDGDFSTIPATYIWSRLVRSASTRASAGQKEMMGYLVGGSRTLVGRLIERIEANGGEVRLNSRVRAISIQSGRVTGVKIGEEQLEFDAVVSTVPVPTLRTLLPEPALQNLGFPEQAEYLGIVCGVVLLDTELAGFYTLNIADEHIPFTGLIETTSLISPEHVGGFHLVYLPKYVTPSNPYSGLSDGELREVYLTNLEQMFPRFDRRWVKHLFVFRERFVEPQHLVGKERPVLSTAYPQLPGLFICNNAQIYPDLTNVQSSVRHALAALSSITGGAGAPETHGVGRVLPAGKASDNRRS